MTNAAHRSRSGSPGAPARQARLSDAPIADAALRIGDYDDHAGVHTCFARVWQALNEAVRLAGSTYGFPAGGTRGIHICQPYARVAVCLDDRHERRSAGWPVRFLAVCQAGFYVFI
jgi:hypothetical protein